MKNTRPKDEAVASAGTRDFKTLFYRKLIETHLFYELGKIIASALEPADLIKRIIAAVRRAVNFQDASVYLVKKNIEGLDPFHSFGPLFEGVKLEPLSFMDGAPGAVVTTGDPLFVEDPAAFKDFYHFSGEARQLSYIGVPLRNDTRIFGVMGLSRSGPAPFLVEDFDTLRTASHLISAGLEKAELFMKTLELARVDELTGLYNYRVLMEKLEEEVRRKVRTGRAFSFIMIDIDDFKKINDRYTHLEGSRLLAQLGPLLKNTCRIGSTDSVYRYGGEEFSVLLAETDVDEAVAVAERVRKAVEEYPFSVKTAHPEAKVTVSLGVSTIAVDEDKSVSTLMSEADIALYRSKAMGKNRVSSYEEGERMPVPGSGH
jgi:diguanylate cyclase (GGDEF)-like protein